MLDGTALIWSLAPQCWKAPEGGLLDEKDLLQLWEDLANNDGAKAYRAVWTLSALAKESVSLLKPRLVPVAKETPARVRELVADLDSADQVVRIAANKSLARMGTAATTALREALANKPSVEMQRRAEPLLEAAEKWVIEDSETLRAVRAIWVLERIGTPDARKLLEDLATGAPEARQTQHARAALQRLRRKP